MLEDFAAWSALELTPGAAELLQRWTFEPLKIDGQTAAIAAIDGTEIHFAIAPEWRLKTITRARTREFLAPLMELRGFLTTRTEPDAAKDRFLRRLGFCKTWNDGLLDHYILTALPFEKEH